MQTGEIQPEHPLDVVYKERVQQEKKLKEVQQRAAFPNPLSAAKHEDPLIKAEIDKNLKEQRKLLEQDLARSLEEIDKQVELKK